MPQFKKKPCVVEAVLWTGTNEDEIRAFVGTAVFRPEGAIITTAEGLMLARPGDWIIRGVQGEFYPCKPDIFSQTYESIP